jgi:SAM-dependent methyltransferase
MQMEFGINNEIMKEIISPLTFSKNVSFVRNIKTKNIIPLYKKYDIDVSGFFENQLEISIYQCNKSGYQFYYPYNLSGDSEFYEHFQNFDWYYMPWKWEHEISIKYIRAGMNILEVGCAHGAFLNKISQDISLGVCTGLELNSSAKFENERFKILNQTIQDFSEKNNVEFDVVCSYQVLEHIWDVHSFLDSKIKCLKPGGLLIVSVPNNDSYIKYSDTALNMPPHHMGLWTQKSLESIADIFNLKIIDIHIEELMEYHVDAYIHMMRYGKGNVLRNRIKRKIEIMLGIHKQFKKNIIKNRKSIVGHTILVVFQKM